MSKTQIIIVYSPTQALRRTVIIPDDDSQVSMHTKNIQPGECVVVGLLSDYRLYGPDAMLSRYLNRQATTDRCAVIDHTGTVVGIVNADPAIDRLPLHRLHRDPQNKAIIGQLALGLSLLP
jgi:hypothetical protein